MGALKGAKVVPVKSGRNRRTTAPGKDIRAANVPFSGN